MKQVLDRAILVLAVIGAVIALVVVGGLLIVTELIRYMPLRREGRASRCRRAA